MKDALLTTLRDIVGEEGLRSDRRECKAYSCDIGVMPSLVSPFVKAGVPGAVVRPVDENQLTRIMRATRAAGVEVVPRAAATSGYGGVLPRKDALVVDLSGWQKVIDVNQTAEIVRCEPGVIWENLDRVLTAQGLEVRLHPSSYLSSTVGGWLAQGGSGFGSYEFGAFKDNVISVRLVDPQGEIRFMEGRDLLDLVADAEGITGIITEVTFKVRRSEETAVRLVSLPDTAALNAMIAGIRSAQLPLWSLTFLNPEAMKLKKRLPGRACHAYEFNEVVSEAAAEARLPETYLLMCAFPASRIPVVDEGLRSLMHTCGGVLLPEEDAQREWKGRIAPMRLKRLGPSIIPTEVVVPSESIAEVLDEIERKIDQPFVLEGMVAADGSAVLLGYIPHDERTFAFNLAFALSLSVVKIANAHGGSGYATGLYFRKQANRILGTQKQQRLRAFKQRVDPDGLMNPGKVLALPGEGGGALDTLMGLALGMESIIRPVANAAKPKRAAVGPQRNGIPGDVAFMAVACSRCGYCVSTCEQYTGRGWESQSPRGKYTWLRDAYAGREKWDRASADTFLSCTTCERCDNRCQLQLPVSHNGMVLRNNLVEEQGMGTFPPFEMMAASLAGEGDIWAGKRAHRADWLPDDVAKKIPEQADVLFFAGCTASYVETDIAEATLRLLQDSGLSVTYGGTEESCCGIPMKMAGKEELFAESYRRNVDMARARGAKTIIASCPACSLVWKEMYAEEARRLGEPYEFEVKHYSEVIAPAIAAGTLKLDAPVFGDGTVTFHDSCHAGRAQGIYEPPRDMLKAIPGINYVEMEHNREDALCCGSVVTLVGELPVAPKLGCARLQEAVDAGANTVVALCPCCQVQLRDSAEKGDIDVKIDDLARVVAVAAGHDIKPTDAYTSYMWSYFERFIVLMQPQQMANFMVRLFPQMLDAMPVGMGSIMRAMGGSKAGTALLTRMMPLMFPKMAPGILGKVMPDMVTEVEAYIGDMPDDMAALMPDLLPKTMDALMPSYVPQLVPPLVPLFVGYLQEEAAKSRDNKLDKGSSPFG